MIVFVFVIVALAAVALAAWLLDRTRPTDDECDCTRCAEKRRAGEERWTR